MMTNKRIALTEKKNTKETIFPKLQTNKMVKHDKRPRTLTKWVKGAFLSLVNSNPCKLNFYVKIS